MATLYLKDLMMKRLLIRLCCIASFAGVPRQSVAWAEGDDHKIGIVRHIGRNVDGPYVVIDTGSSDRYTIGLDVCFFNEQDIKVACGTIVRTKPRAAGVILDAADEGRVKSGFLAFIKGESPKPKKVEPDVPRGPYVEPTADQERDGDEPEPEPPEPDEPPSPALLNRRWSLEPAYAWRLPLQANELDFDANARSSGKGTLWSSGKRLSSSYVGFAATLYWPLPGLWETSFVLGYHFIPQSVVKNDFDLTDATASTTIATWQHLYRVRWRLDRSVVHTDSSDLFVGSGLELVAATTKFKGTYTSSTDSGDLVSGSITGSVLSLPLSSWYETKIGGWNVLGGIDVTIPIKQQSSTLSGSVPYSASTGKAKKDINAAADAVNQTKAIGCVLHVGFGAHL